MVHTFTVAELVEAYSWDFYASSFDGGLPNILINCLITFHHDSNPSILKFYITKPRGGLPSDVSRQLDISLEIAFRCMSHSVICKERENFIAIFFL